MLRGLIVALLAIAIAACSFNVPGPSVFRCDTDNACPADQDCVHGYCVPAEAPPGVPGASHCPAPPRRGARGGPRGGATARRRRRRVTSTPARSATTPPRGAGVATPLASSA